MRGCIPVKSSLSLAGNSLTLTASLSAMVNFLLRFIMGSEGTTVDVLRGVSMVIYQLSECWRFYYKFHCVSWLMLTTLIQVLYIVSEMCTNFNIWVAHFLTFEVGTHFSTFGCTFLNICGEAHISQPKGCTFLNIWGIAHFTPLPHGVKCSIIYYSTYLTRKSWLT